MFSASSVRTHGVLARGLWLRVAVTTSPCAATPSGAAAAAGGSGTSVETRSGATVAYALMVDDVGPIADTETHQAAVLEDEGGIASLGYGKR